MPSGPRIAARSRTGRRFPRGPRASVTWRSRSPPPLAEALEQRGIARLYTHQVQAIEALRGGLDTVVVTGTASGKSLCYHLPVLETLLAEPEATALYLFPTKALAQDQLKGLTRLARGTSGSAAQCSPPASTTATRRPTTRRKLRDTAT